MGSSTRKLAELDRCPDCPLCRSFTTGQWEGGNACPLTRLARRRIAIVPAIICNMSREPPCLLSASTIASMPGTQKAHFLNSEARRLNKSLGDATGLQRLGIHWVEVPPGSLSTEQHRHFCEEEAVYVLAGTGILELDDDALPISEGDFVGLPAGGPAHAFRCSGDVPLRLLVVGQRLKNDVADFPRLKKRLYRNDGKWDLVEHSAIIDPKQLNPSAGTK